MMNRLNRKPIAFIMLVLLTGLLPAACISPTPPSATSLPTAPATFVPTSLATEMLLATITPTQPPTQTPIPARAATFIKLSSLQDVGKIYNQFEMNIETDGVASNPFDPAQFDLQVHFISPGKKGIVGPAFWYQDFDKDTLLPVGGPQWRVRFTPTEPGEWTAQAELASSKLKSDPVSFKVGPVPDARGFIRINPKNRLYFAYDDGSFFFPVGINLAWSVGDVLGDYERWLDRFSQNDGNLIRVWMASWSFGIEWKDTGLGNYSARMKQAWLLDQVFRMAEERGVTIMLCLINHGAFSETTNPEWADNPYNIDQGGPLKAPQDFVTDPTARDLFKRRLRYIASRWSYSTSLFAWEWWNEINWTPISTDTLRPWLTEMTDYLDTLDPNKHLVTHSTTSGDPIWNAPELQISQLHDYSGEFFPWKLGRIFQNYQKLAPGKPVLVGEFGFSASGDDSLFSRQPIYLHNGLWTAPFVGFAGTGMYWWWDNYVDPYNHWGEFRIVSDYFRGEPLSRMTPGQVKVTPGGATALVLQNDQRALVWIVNNAFNMKDAQIAYQNALLKKQVSQDWKYEPTVLENIRFTLIDLKDGDYQLIGYSPSTGEWQEAVPVKVENGSLTITLPKLQSDWAWKIVRVP